VAFTITKTIRPNAVWQEMYLQVQKDQRVIISAEGLWSPEMRPLTIVWCGPDGIEGRPAGDRYLLPGTNVGALDEITRYVALWATPVRLFDFARFASREK